MGDDGFIKISELMESKEVAKWKPKFNDILKCVELNDKKRFQIKVDPPSDVITLENGYIRASQGHTMEGIEEEKLLTRIKFPYSYPTIVHGSYSKVLNLILENGLCKMERNHIHLAKGYAGNKGVISGMRASWDIFIEINLAKAIHDEIPVYESANGVILTAGIDGYLPPKYFRRITEKKNKFLYSAPLDYIIVFDFECTCDDDKNNKFDVQEIIEFPAVIVNAKTMQMVKAFQTYVKPSKYPNLTDFCTELTGITQEQVDNGVSIETALAMFHKFLENNNVLGSEFVVLSCGDFDAGALKKEAEFKDIFVPSYMKEWINIKKVFPLHLYDTSKEEIVDLKIKQQKSVVTGMLDMLKHCDLELLGRHHSGIDDSFNIARWVAKCLEDGFEFTQSHIANTGYQSSDEALADFQNNIEGIQAAQNAFAEAREIAVIDTETHLEMMVKWAEENK
jgi:inhibitor of KinA sporulation pathway (predicted exonuclease)/RNA:NAD 2'-phosphotransferase (TPT1/KptA family)